MLPSKQRIQSGPGCAACGNGQVSTRAQGRPEKRQQHQALPTVTATPPLCLKLRSAALRHQPPLRVAPKRAIRCQGHSTQSGCQGHGTQSGCQGHGTQSGQMRCPAPSCWAQGSIQAEPSCVQRPRLNCRPGRVHQKRLAPSIIAPSCQMLRIASTSLWMVSRWLGSWAFAPLPSNHH
jgi:hypothetical protein